MFTAKGEAAKDLTVYKWLNLLTIQAMLMFVLAVFFSLQVSGTELLISLLCFGMFDLPLVMEFHHRLGWYDDDDDDDDAGDDDDDGAV
jgi:hypothetical protein